jgi:Raf kinase inhibitor-like YbhB/YbcL family protein
VAAATTITLLAACGDDDNGGADQLAKHPVDKVVRVTSTSFAEGAPIPKQYTCDGPNTQPQLAWTGIPSKAKEVAVVVDDPDAGGGTFVHWVLFGLKPSVTSLPEGGPLPDGARQAKNGAGKAAWMGPCPPPPDPAHHYRFTVYGLDHTLDVNDGADKEGALAAIQEAAISKGVLTATFDH